jgi:hypothetical protein
MIQEPEPAITACPKCHSTDIHSSVRKGNQVMHHRCRSCFHLWDTSLLSQFPSERELERMADRLQKRNLTTRASDE